MVSPRVFFYVQHLLGIGHLARASRIATSLSKNGYTVTVVTGGLPVPGFPPAGINSIALPAVATGNLDYSTLVDEHGDVVGPAFLAMRREKLLSAFHSFAPHVVILEAFPFGRRQMSFELLPLLDAVRLCSPRPKVLTSVRDIIEPQSKLQRDEETVSFLRDYFDAVLVHGDPRFIHFDETFRLTEKIAEKIVYTGLVAPIPPTEANETFQIVVSAGGGASGLQVLEASQKAARIARRDLRWCLISGPYLPEADFSTLAQSAPPNVQLVRFREDFLSLLRGAEISISRAGYNTVCDILATGCRSLLVPFIGGGETEQTVRAKRLQTIGRAKVLSETNLTAEILASAIDTALVSPKSFAHGLDLDGSEKTVSIIRALLS
ncbi:glycosyl transferase [Agrobacterium tumefaciens]|uniref:glycosyltransferase family protein n=1 Tax=Agrobacterium tumefaciens TaxID=358 RepID=UPI00080FCD21|nr:glycosyl transferase [Agrobacterium tumefaciens]